MCEVEKQFVLLLGCEADWGREKEEAKPTFPLQFLLGICVKWDCVHWRCFSVRLRWIKSSSLTRSSPTASRQHKQRDLWTASGPHQPPVLPRCTDDTNTRIIPYLHLWFITLFGSLWIPYSLYFLFFYLFWILIYTETKKHTRVSCMHVQSWPLKLILTLVLSALFKWQVSFCEGAILLNYPVSSNQWPELCWGDVFGLTRLAWKLK